MKAPRAYLMPQEVCSLINIAFFRCNQPIEQKTSQIVSTDFQRILQQKYPTLTIKELEYVFDNGVFGAYGSNYGLSEVTFCRWIDSYMTSDERLAALQKFQTSESIAALPQKTPPTPQEKRDLDINYLINKWCDYLKKGEDIFEFGNTFDTLQRLGVYKFTQEEWKEAFKKAQQKNADKAKKKDYSLTRFIQDKFTTSEREIKRECVFIYFKELKEAQINFLDILSEKFDIIITSNVK